MMQPLKLLRNDGGAPIIVPADATELTIHEPVSDLANAGEVIRSLAQLEKLFLYTRDLGKPDLTESLDFLRGAKNLKFLAIGSMRKLRYCAALAECKSLEWLVIRGAVPFDFQILPLMPSLRKLQVETPGNKAVTRIAKTTQLTSLEIGGGFKLGSLEILAGLKNLEYLRLWHGSIESSRGLSALARLQTLDLGHSKLRDTAELGEVKGLKKMELVGNKFITNLEFLRGGDLEVLKMYQIPKLDSLKPLSRVTNLKEFYCEAKIMDEDLHTLVSMPSLEKAAIAGRYKAALKKIRVNCSCAFKAGRETLKVTEQGPLVLETASEAREHLRKKLNL